MALYRMRNGVQHYAWGSPTEITRLTGIPNPDGEPMAELWMGDHPRLPSSIVSGSRVVELGEFLEHYPSYALGETAAKRSGSRLPFLFKLLSAAEGLSIQVHPSRSQASEGYDREEAAGIPPDASNRNYKDRNHKPEILLAVTPFWALSGFRDPRAIAEDFRHVEGADSLVGRLEDGDLEGFYRKLISPGRGDTTERKRIFEGALQYAGRNAESNAGSRFSWVVELNRQFPEDMGALAPLYLNCLHLDPGEALFLESGLLHAYLQGTGVELMANSDNVLRGGCTVKHVDITELLRVLRFESTDEPRFPGKRRLLPGAVATTFSPPVDEFVLEKIELSGEHSFEKGPGPAILFVLRGSLICRGATGDSAGRENGGSDGEPAVAPPADCPGEDTVALSSGESVFVPAATGGLTLSGSCEAYVALG
jgi:mannose-6-phosphate isomerase